MVAWSVIFLAAAWTGLSEPARTSSVILTPDEKTVCSVNEDSSSVSLWSWAGDGTVREVPVGEEPRTLAASRDGARLYVACQRAETLDVVDLGAARREASIELGGQPHGVLLAAGGRRAFITQYAGGYIGGRYVPGLVAVVDLSAAKVAARIPVKARPWAMALSADGRSLLVTHYLQVKGDGIVTELDAEALSVRREYRLRETSGLLDGRCGVFNALAGIAIHPGGRRAAVVGMLANVRRGTALSGRPLSHKTTVQAALAILDLESGREVEGARLLSSFSGQAVAVPSAVAFLGGGEHFIDLYFDSSDFKVIRWNEGGVAAERALRSLPPGPTGVALTADGAHAFFNCRWARSVAHVSIADPRDPAILESRRTAAEPWSEERLRGAILFHGTRDSRMTANRWLSCGACHLDGGLISDALVWDLTVPGAPRKVSNTMDLVVAPGTAPPFFHRGTPEAIPALERFVRIFQKGSGFLAGGAGPGTALDASGDWDGSGNGKGPATSPEWRAIAAYMGGMVPRPSPHQARGLPRPEIREAAQRGRRLFYDPVVGCARCHDGPRLTISGTGAEAVFDVGTGKALDTPSLLHLWDTAPYLHDGSAADLREVLTTSNAGDLHGKTSHLAPGEIEDLEIFLLSPCGGDDPEKTHGK